MKDLVVSDSFQKKNIKNSILYTVIKCEIVNTNVE